MPQYWEVVGGADKGGILVRDGQATGSAQLGTRLSTGAIVEELQLIQERLNYKLFSGDGPEVGWVSIKLPGKDLLLRVEQPAVEGGSEILKVPGGELTVKAYEEYMAEFTGQVPELKSDFPIMDYDPFMEGHVEKISKGEVFSPAFVPTAEQVKEATFADPVVDPALERYRERSRNNNALMDDLKPLPPYIKLKPGEVKKLAVDAIPGEMYGLIVPPTLADLYKYGEEWLTKAFHAAGTMPKDNRITKIVEFKRLPMSGQDAAGGSGPKAFLTVEYEKEDPELHKELFVKMPWTVGGESKEMGGDKLWRAKISCNVDNDGQEVTVYRMLGPLFPFHIPKYYFADICRANTNFILVTEKLLFGKKGQTEFKPMEFQPLAEKYFDFQLPIALRSDMYYSLVRAQARMAAWERLGYFDKVPGETRGHHMAPPLLMGFPRQVDPAKRQELRVQSEMVQAVWRDFLQDKGKKCYPKQFSEEKFVKALVECVEDAFVYRDDMGLYHHFFPDMVGMMHTNLQSDNAYYWRDEEGKLDCGIIDWGGLSPGHIVHRLSGMITSALGEVLDEHEDMLLWTFVSEFFKECGILIDFGELKRQWHLSYNTYVYSCGFNIIQEVYRQVPKGEWETINTLMDKRSAGNWNTRCYVFMILHMLKYLWIRWKRSGEGALHCHQVLLGWKEWWEAKGMS